MKSTYTLAAAIVALIIIIGGIFAYTQLSNAIASPNERIPKLKR